jgi:hypothetical protein
VRVAVPERQRQRHGGAGIELCLRSSNSTPNA